MTLKINQKQFRKTESEYGRKLRGKVRALDRRLKYYRNELPYLMLTQYRKGVINAIRSQDPSYMGGYEPLNEKYLAYKQSKGFNTGFWRMTSDLLRELQSPDSAEISNSDFNSLIYVLSIAPYELGKVTANEFGTSKIPSRPLFTPAFQDLEIEFLMKTGTYLEDLHNTWRRS